MICKRCFRLSDDDEQYCPYCGKSFTDDSEIDVSEKKEKEEAENESKTDPEKEEIRFFTDNNNNGGEHTSPPPFTPPPYIPPREVPMPRWLQFITSVSHALLYFFLFLTIQSIVAAGFAGTSAAVATVDCITEYCAANGINPQTLSNEEYSSLITTLEPDIEAAITVALNEIDYNFLSVVASAVTVVAVCIIAKLKRRTLSEHTDLYFSPLKRWRAWLVIPAGIAIQFLTIFLLNIIPFSEETLQSYNELYAFIGDSPLWLEILSVVIGAPVVEEIIFRGCIHSRLRRVMPPLATVLISAFIFGVAHDHIIAFSYAFPLGLVLAYLYEKYDSIVVPILFHMAFNASNYLPVMNEGASSLEVLIVLAVSLVVFAAVTTVIVTDDVSARRAKTAPQSNIPSDEPQNNDNDNNNEGL